MFDIRIKDVMKRHRMVRTVPHTTVMKAAKLMADKNVGAVLVIEDGHLEGIFTERDVVFRVVARGLDPRTTPIADVMTRAPYTITADKPFGMALLLMHEKGFRHLPVVQDGKPIGIVSARSAMDPDLEEFVSEAQRRHHFRQTLRP